MVCIIDFIPLLPRRQLDLDERRDYIRAVLCLASQPAISGLENAATHFDDFQATHSDQTPSIHWVVSIACLI